MGSDELETAERERDGIKERLRLLREGSMKTLTGPQLENDTTDISIEQAEQQLKALERKIARLKEKDT